MAVVNTLEPSVQNRAMNDDTAEIRTATVAADAGAEGATAQAR
jgi:hypothetical protein